MTGIKNQSVSEPYIWLMPDGELRVWNNYAWDGASGPAVDTTTNIRASLFHDALYQLISLGLLPKKYRKAADKLYRRICREDGMSWLRAAWQYYALRLFGGLHCGTA